jgi:UDP-N-acetylmuramate dehydrogenase
MNQILDFSSNYDILIKGLGELRIKKDESMRNHTTFKIGGPADLFYEAYEEKELVKAIKLARELSIPIFILGGGTNILVSDKGIRGLVIKNRAAKVRIVGLKGKGLRLSINEVYVEAEGGALINQVVRFCLDEGLEGLEFLLSIPGTIGGAIKINAHFRPEKNEFIGNALCRALLLTPKNEIIEVDRNYFNFGYDQSLLQKSGDILLAATFRLRKKDKEKIWQEATFAVKKRQESQPVGIPCSGCIFRNPKDKAAGYLLDKVGLKGFRVGQACFSDKHANFILNLDGANACDVLELIKIAKVKVKEKFGIDLQEEIFYIGEF